MREKITNLTRSILEEKNKQLNFTTTNLKTTNEKLNSLFVHFHKKIPEKIPDISGKVDNIKNIKKTYELIQELSLVNGLNPSEKLLHRTMFNSETLPHFGKEYWWFLFIEQNTDNPMQIMFLLFRKHGQQMQFNNKNMKFKSISNNCFQGISTCWIWDGEKMHDLGDTNAITTVDSKNNTLVSRISNHEVHFSGSYPNFKLKIGDTVNLNMTERDRIGNKDAYATFLPPFGIGWIDMFSNANGTVLGKKFKGNAHLQKVVGVTTSGCFNWGKILFEKGHSLSFFCIKPKKDSNILFYTSITFYNNETKTITKFNSPKINISKKEPKNKKENLQWIIQGFDDDKQIFLILDTYAKKEFNMRTVEWQTYIEYLVSAKEFIIKIKDKELTLDKTGKGTGTFEDAYGFIF